MAYWEIQKEMEREMDMAEIAEYKGRCVCVCVYVYDGVSVCACEYRSRGRDRTVAGLLYVDVGM
jgi:hypothetical protein